jgi:hypothetical protein
LRLEGERELELSRPDVQAVQQPRHSAPNDQCREDDCANKIRDPSDFGTAIVTTPTS